MSNTGDGHRASAEALRTGFQQYFPGQFHISVLDVAEHLPWPLSQLPRSYGPLTNRLPSVWDWLWKATASRTAIELLARPGAWYARHALIQTIDACDPDIIISVHPMLQHITQDALSHLNRDIRFFTVVTDLVTAHPAWFHPNVDLCFVASAEAKRRAVKWGIPAHRIHENGLPVRSAFTQSAPDRVELRRRLNMHPTLPAALITGGGEGFGPIVDIAVHLAEALSSGVEPRGQLVIICGRNRRLKRRLHARDWPVPVRITGYVENMAQWMFASDCMATKAGPGAIAEAFVCGVPLMLTGFIPGQEVGNVDYVVANGAGWYESDPRRIAAITQHWLQPNCSERQRIVANATRLARPEATRQIVAEIATYSAERSR